MRSVALVLVLFAAVFPSTAQTLRDSLRQAGVPEATFSGAELTQGVNASNAKQGALTWVAYMRLDAKNVFEGFPEIIQYDSKTGAVIRRELRTGKSDECCGSPDGIDFTRNYILFSFDLSPSAGTVLVVDHALRLIEVLYGFDFHEIAPDQVVFIENMIHFAPQQSERLRLVDLPSGKTEELYPPKGDALRATFAQANKDHMPSQDACRVADDPCEPGLFDEDIAFLSASRDGTFQIRVEREAEHSRIYAGVPHKFPAAAAVYIYRRVNDVWHYCEQEIAPVALASDPYRAPTAAPPHCIPNLPVAAEPSDSPFPTIRKVK